jgi:hypothetical protein
VGKSIAVPGLMGVRLTSSEPPPITANTVFWSAVAAERFRFVPDPVNGLPLKCPSLVSKSSMTIAAAKEMELQASRLATGQDTGARASQK